MTVRWGLIGAGATAREWVIDAIRAAGGEVMGVLCRDIVRGRQFADAHHIPRVAEDIHTLLRDSGVRAVYISSGVEQHLAQAVAAAEAGRHVLCEGPLALSLADARQMVAACRTHRVVLGTDHHLRGADVHRLMRRLIAEGRIGQPLFARVVNAGARPAQPPERRGKDPRAGAGVVMRLTAHDADALRFVLDDEPVAVSAMARRDGTGEGGIEDGVMGVLRFRSGLLAQFHDAFATPTAHTGFEVHGTEGSLVAVDCMTQRPIGRLLLRTPAGDEELELAHGNPYERALREFHAAVEGRGAPLASGEDGVRSLAVALATLDAASNGHEMPIEPGS